MRCCIFPLSKGAETLYRGFYYRNGDFRIKTKMGGLSKEMKFLVNEINSINSEQEIPCYSLWLVFWMYSSS